MVSSRGEDGQTCEKVSEEVKKFTPNGSWGWRQFIVRDTNDKEYLSDDELTMRCDISYAMERENIVNQDPRSHARCDSASVLNEIYQTRMHSDLVLSLDGKEFRAHKAVLAARSPFLNFLFELDINEGKTSLIDAHDMNEGTLEDLLRFIYTDEAEVPDNMSNLLARIDQHVRRR